jgi:hypothetical protein
MYDDLNTTEEHASYIMSRYWNVNVTSGSIDPAQPVSLRFFFDPNEATEVIDARDAEYANYTDSYKTDWRWFKSEGVAFDPNTNISGNAFNFPNITLNVIANAQINHNGVDVDYTGTINGVHYAEFTDITSFSGGSGGIGFGIGDGGLLPIELLSFKGNEQARFNLLSWSTATETNNAYFEIERSKDGRNFELAKKVAGSGNSSETKNYQTEDYDYFMPVTYYRLKQTDNDGKYAYSKIISVRREKTSGLKLDLYPNPTSGIVNINTYASSNEQLEVSVKDASGKTLINQMVYILEGYNVREIDLNMLSSGIYFVEIKSQSESIVKKISKY